MNQPIGIFDSGLGGLTVLKALAQKFPGESFCYVGDIARLPYGNKSPETIRKYGVQILDYLKRENVKALIIACNSASTVFLNEKHYQGLPLLNVIGPGSRAALAKSADKRIAVLGTSATIRSGAYGKTLRQLDPSAMVIERACPLFVPLAEEGMSADDITLAVARRYLQDIKDQAIATVVLGCTHYPLLKADILKALTPTTQLIESGEVLAEELSQLFAAGELRPASPGSVGELRIKITDLTDHFERLALQLMHPLSIGPLERIVL
jgi:glutamate racemase